MQRASFLDTVNSVALFIFFIYHGTERGSKLSVPLEEVMTVHSTTLIDKCMGSFKSLDRTSRV